MKRIMLGLFLDETINRLSLVTKHQDYVFQTIKAIENKHYLLVKQDSRKLNKAYSLLNEAWIQAQKTFIDAGKEFSNVLLIKYLIEDYDWMIDYFNIKQKRLDKLYNSYDLSKHIFRTKQVYNEVIKQIDISLAQYNYRIKKQKFSYECE